MKITVPIVAIPVYKDRQAFDKKLKAIGLKVAYHLAEEYTYIWETYKNSDDAIAVVTFSSVDDPDGAKLLRFLREDYLAVSMKAFARLLSNAVLRKDEQDPDRFFFNFRKLEGQSNGTR